MNIHRARRRIARIRCLQDCIQCFKSKRQLPECVCYVPSELNYTCNARSFIQVYKEPSTNSARIRDVTGGVESSLVVSGEEMCNAEGKWLKLKKVRLLFLNTQHGDTLVGNTISRSLSATFLLLAMVAMNMVYCVTFLLCVVFVFLLKTVFYLSD